MGGYGSNRWGAYKRKLRVTECLRLSIPDLVVLEANTKVVISWNTVYYLGIYRTQNRVLLVYQGENRLNESVQIVDHLGKVYGCCTGCNRRVLYLYKPPNKSLFRCRSCHNLTYRSVQERRKYQGLARLLAVGSGMPVNQFERFLSSWATHRT